MVVLDFGLAWASRAPLGLESFSSDSESSRVWNVPGPERGRRAVGAGPPSRGLQGGLGSPWGGWMGAEPHAKNVAMGCSVNVFKMKKGRLNPND